MHYSDHIGPASDAARAAGGGLVYLGLTGSRAYGTHHEDSDHDYKGIYVAELPRVLRFDQKAPGNLSVAGDADITLYELGHFFKLAADANPTVLELLWTDDFVASPLGQEIHKIRTQFLSRRVEHTYGGYAMAQLKKAREGSGGSRGHNQYKRTKFKLHTLRLLEAGIHALKHGEIRVQVADPKGLRARAEGYDLDQLEQAVHQGCEIMHLMAINSSLPEKPEFDKLNEVLYTLRTSHLSRRSL
jgi:predicted nucleotidyltransferase